MILMEFPFIDLPHAVRRIRREVSPELDSLGNQQTIETDEVVRVAGWAVPSSDEPTVAGHERETVDVQLFAAVGDFRSSDAVALPRYGLCEVVGVPRNYEHGPFGWSPSLEVVNLRREGP